VLADVERAHPERIAREHIQLALKLILERHH
jgi:hypothetical protein